jgi:hypothetical protein
MTGARYQIAVDGQPRSNRDTKLIAIEAAEYLKYKHPHAEVTVQDLMTGDTITNCRLRKHRAGAVAMDQSNRLARAVAAG